MKPECRLCGHGQHTTLVPTESGELAPYCILHGFQADAPTREAAITEVPVVQRPGSAPRRELQFRPARRPPTPEEKIISEISDEIDRITETREDDVRTFRENRQWKARLGCCAGWSIEQLADLRDQLRKFVVVRYGFVGSLTKFTFREQLGAMLEAIKSKPAEVAGLQPMEIAEPSEPEPAKKVTSSLAGAPAPAKRETLKEQAQRLVSDGHSVRGISKMLKIPRTTLRRMLRPRTHQKAGP